MIDTRHGKTRVSHSPETAAVRPRSPLGWLDDFPRIATLLLFGLVLLAYWPALDAQFMWDDAGHLTGRTLFPLSGLGRIWFEPGATQQYYPTLHSAFWVEHRLWGDSAFCYHLLNILLHATAACLFARLLRRLAVPGAWLAALLFALHPVCAETVSWVSEQKNTLSTVFYLLAAVAYLDFDETRQLGRYVWASAFFFVALSSKTVTATLPAALLVIAWWRRGRIDWRRDVLPVVPWLLLGFAAGIFTAHVEHTLIGAHGEGYELSLVDRGLIAGRVVWFYAAKLLWPANLIFIYPRWTVDATQVWQYAFPLAAVVVLAVLAWRARRTRTPLAIALLFGGSLFPALGFVNVFPFIYSFVADHFQYLASLALFATAGGLLARASALWPRWMLSGAIAVLLAAFVALTRQQVPIYHDNETLFTNTIARNPSCWMAYTNLAEVYSGTGRGEKAVATLETALRWRPDYPEGENNLGDVLNQLGRPAEAVPHLLRSIQLRPSNVGAYNNLGVAYSLLGRTTDGIAAFEKALRSAPNDAQTHYNLAMALEKSGRTAEAMPHFVQAAGMETSNPTAHANLAMALTLQGQYPEAFQHFDRLIELMPNDAEARDQYGRALARADRIDAAIKQFRDAVELNPKSAGLHADLAAALRKKGLTSEADEEQREAERRAQDAEGRN